MSSNMEDGTHYDTSPRGTTDNQLAGSPKCGLPAARHEEPEARAVTLQPTPSPYQDSNCDHNPCSDGQVVHKLASSQMAGTPDMHARHPAGCSLGTRNLCRHQVSNTADLSSLSLRCSVTLLLMGAYIYNIYMIYINIISS